jgi:23S rRNA (guanosine2251-2'-O)-methyltransferase
VNTEDLIIGQHSIFAALKNSKRKKFQLYGTNESLKRAEFKNPNIKLHNLSPHQLQLEAKRQFESRGFNYQRVPNNLFLLSDPTSLIAPQEVFRAIEQSENSLKIVILDRVSDQHNLAAVLRSAAFFGVDFMAFSLKNFRFSPNFYRIASGAVEFVKVVQTPNLSRFIQRLNETGKMNCVGLDEGGEENESFEQNRENKCLILGSEEHGLSHAVKRSIPHLVCLKGYGQITTLNISVAAGISMQRFFNHT